MNSGNAKLYHIIGGYAEGIRFLCIGHGSPYATSISKFLYERDASVGGKPQVLMVKNGNSPVETLADNIVEEMEKKAKETKKNLKECRAKCIISSW